MWSGEELGQDTKDLYVSTKYGFSLGVEALDGKAIELFRVATSQAWTEYSIEQRLVVSKCAWMAVCEYVYGNGAGMDETKVVAFMTAVGNQINAAIKSGGPTRAIIDGHEVSYIGTDVDIVGIEASTARAEGWQS